MYIPAFWAGVLATIFTELALIIVWATFSKPRR